MFAVKHFCFRGTWIGLTFLSNRCIITLTGSGLYGEELGNQMEVAEFCNLFCAVEWVRCLCRIWTWYMEVENRERWGHIDRHLQSTLPWRHGSQVELFLWSWLCEISCNSLLCIISQCAKMYTLGTWSHDWCGIMNLPVMYLTFSHWGCYMSWLWFDIELCCFTKKSLCMLAKVCYLQLD
jgi:hypothetical protein